MTFHAARGKYGTAEVIPNKIVVYTQIILRKCLKVQWFSKFQCASNFSFRAERASGRVAALSRPRWCGAWLPGGIGRNPSSTEAQPTLDTHPEPFIDRLCAHFTRG